MMTWSFFALGAGFLLDLLIGDPRWLYHPVCIIGNAISFLEKRLRRIFPKTPSGEKIAGTVLTVLICLGSFGIPLVIVWLAYRIHPWFGFAVEAWMCCQLLATRSLKEESMKVYDQLADKNLDKARYAVSMIVGRDTQELSEEGVTKATVETIAENTSDGIVAPMFYMAIGGAPLMFLYKGINTMDSMIAYKNDKYLYFGRCAAHLDDIANYLPARISGILMIIGSYLGGFNGRHAAKIFKRDRFNHASPNSAQTEAVMAGALDVQLAGNAYYFGKLYEKPSIGDPIRSIRYDDIRKANKLLYITGTLGMLAFSLLRFGILWGMGV